MKLFYNMNSVTGEISRFLSGAIATDSGFAKMIEEVDETENEETVASLVSNHFTFTPEVFYTTGSKIQTLTNTATSNVSAGTHIRNSMNNFEIRLSVGKDGSFTGTGLYSAWILFCDQASAPSMTWSSAPNYISLASGTMSGFAIGFTPNASISDINPFLIRYWKGGASQSGLSITAMTSWDDTILRYNGIGVSVFAATTMTELFNSYPNQNLQDLLRNKELYVYTYMRSDSALDTNHRIIFTIRQNILNN